MKTLNQDMNPQIRKKLYRKAAQNRIPISGTFELTPRCNMNCRMCYIRMSESEMKKEGREYTAQEWIEMGRICKEAGMLFLVLTGGEPFLRRDFRQIYTELCKMGFVITINSNGTMIDSDTVEWLKDNPPSKINITLYGASNETYKNLCGNDKGFEQACQAIKLLKGAGIHVGINATFTPYNVSDMDYIYNFAKENEIQVREAIYTFPPVRCSSDCISKECQRFTPSEAGQAMFNSKKNQMDLEEFKQFTKGIKYRLDFPEKFVNIYANKDENCELINDSINKTTTDGPEHMSCIAGRCLFCITWNGKMTPCSLMSEPYSYPFIEGFSKSWDYICKKVDEILLPIECTKCEKRFACNVCGALTIAEGNGVSTKKPEYMCGMTDEYLKLCNHYND